MLQLLEIMLTRPPRGVIPSGPSHRERILDQNPGMLFRPQERGGDRWDRTGDRTVGSRGPYSMVVPYGGVATIRAEVSKKVHEPSMSRHFGHSSTTNEQLSNRLKDVSWWRTHRMQILYIDAPST